MKRTAAQAASDYYNSLPFEQRRQLAPLLDDYRRMGIQEALRGLASVNHNLTLRVRGITAALDAPELDDATASAPEDAA